MIDQNPFFTKNGTITLEITLSLLNPENARIYKHYNRINNELAIVSNRTARLIVDNKVLIDGSEIILEITEKEVKIQLASGESELNYFIGGERKLHDLDLGRIEYQNDTSTAGYTYTPIYSSNENKIRNDYSITMSRDSAGHETITSIGPLRDIPQTYLYHAINLVIKALGYKKKSSVFDPNTGSETWYYSLLFIVNGISSFGYANRKMKFNRTLPNWTVNEFFTEIEKLFAVVFLIDKNTKDVNIVFQKDFYTNSKKYYILELVDEYSQKVDVDNKNGYSIANIGYSLPSDDYFDLQNIDPEILDVIAGNVVDEKENFNEILAAINNESNKDLLKRKLFYSKESDTQYICYEEESENGTKTFYPQKVNLFAPIRNNPDSDEIDIELKITPAPIKTVDIDVYALGTYEFSLRTQMPVITTGTYTEEFYDIQTAIEEGMNNSENNQLMLAFDATIRSYQPGDESDYSNRWLYFKAAHVDCFEADFYKTKEGFNHQFSLRLRGKYGLQSLYENTINIDTTREYTFKFIHNTIPDTKAIFVINNKEFVCVELKYTINPKGMHPVIEGKFFQVMD
jgi:hypothetical protein